MLHFVMESGELIGIDCCGCIDPIVNVDGLDSGSRSPEAHLKSSSPVVLKHVPQIFLDSSSQNSWPAQLMAKASVSFSPKTSGGGVEDP